MTLVNWLFLLSASALSLLLGFFLGVWFVVRDLSGKGEGEKS